jgi:glycosyltransferase involved in cell wall biosynthesis
MKVACIIPVYNEAEVLERSVRKVLAWGFARFGRESFVLAISDNGSTDDTMNIAKRLAEEFPQVVRVFHLPLSGQKGEAVKHAAAGLDDAEAYLMSDVDLSVDLESAGRLLDLVLSGTDLAIGSRRMPDSVVSRPLSRRFVTATYAFLADFVLGLGIRDLQCGCKAFSRRVRDCILPAIEDKGMFYDTEMIALAEGAHLNVTEVGVRWTEKNGFERASKMNIFKLAPKFLAKLWSLRGRRSTLC